MRDRRGKIISMNDEVSPVYMVSNGNKNKAFWNIRALCTKSINGLHTEQAAESSKENSAETK